MSRKLKDGKAAGSSIHPGPPVNIHFITCVGGGARLSQNLVAGWGKPSWKKLEWLEAWSLDVGTSYTKHKKILQ
jgi:hypothetical protein